MLISDIRFRTLDKRTQQECTVYFVYFSNANGREEGEKRRETVLMLMLH